MYGDVSGMKGDYILHGNGYRIGNGNGHRNEHGHEHRNGQGNGNMHGNGQRDGDSMVKIMFDLHF